MDFLNFIKLRFQSLEALGTKPQPPPSNRAQVNVSGVSTQSGSCFMCQEVHPPYKCPAFLKRTPRERLQAVQRANHCVNCLKYGHSAKNCNSSSCTKCNKKHNSLLHLEGRQTESKRDFRATALETTNNSSTQHVVATAFNAESTNCWPSLLSTVCINITDSSGNKQQCRALLDSGSQANFITTNLAKKLGLQINPRTIGIEGIGRTLSQSTGRVNITISSMSTAYTTNLEAFVLPKIISTQPPSTINTTNWRIPSNIRLSDVNFATPSRIDMLIGAGLFYSILSVGQIALGPGCPTLQKTVFGWVVGGEYSHDSAIDNIHCGVGAANEMDQSLERFWKVEEFETGTETFTASERRCEEHFLKHIRRHTDGRFIVNLPFEVNPNQLGTSRDIALQRFKAIERKLHRDSQLRAEYIKFMQEYEKLGHMQEVPLHEIHGNHYFLPHHAVFKLDSTTTKVRVVFDASAKTSTNYSLNDVLATGPTIQADVFTTILRFRLPRFAFTADIEKMYRQVWVSKEDRKFQLIWWREDPSLPLRCMQLSTVTYGTTCAPFLATRILQYIADASQDQYPLATKALRNNFYVDDVLSGADRLATALELQKQLTEVLRSAGLNLRKWCANDPRLLEKIPYDSKEISFDISNSSIENIKTMGIQWYPKDDVFTIKINQDNNSRVTKRTALADISRLFDPLGLVAPVVVIAKIFLQQLWKLQLDWDAALPQELHTKWLRFRKELETLQQLKIARHIFNHTVPKNIQLHIFADASEAAYGATAYVRSVDRLDVVIVRLLCSKSRVAPVKQLTLPRLELCAAKLATDLAIRLKHDKILESSEIYYWTDSTAVLGWINATSANYHTFVANRVSAIQQASTPQQWHHVRTDQNPADHISRGLMPEQLINNVLWFYGPLFLHAPMTAWPLQLPRTKCTLEIREKHVTAAIAASTSDSIFNLINHKNSLPRLQRIVAYMLRLGHRRKSTKHQPDDQPIPPTAIEMDLALKRLVQISQQQDFADELKSLFKDKVVHNNSSISSLSPFLDDNGIIRVGGRLEAAELSFDAKHQILLAYHSPLTKLIFNHFHKEHLHVGAQTLLSMVRQRFWPLKAKNVARATIQGCVFCTRAKPKLFEQLMGDLPKDRVQPSRPFINTGVDFFGPVWVHVKIRGKRPLKAYVAVFCCFATKAVHLELVSDLSTDAFLGALRRFMARRGHCQKLYCDNATNFVGAKNQLAELSSIIHQDKAKQKILHECSRRNIDFEFIPPRAPHFGGLWEAAVKSAKHLLQSTISCANLTREEMETLLAEAEAIMNSRPLTPMSTDPNDLTALTPGHFLIGEPLTATVDPHAVQDDLRPSTRWKLVTQLKKQFWTRWTTEYLHSLQHRYKWRKEAHDILPNTMVLIKDDNLPSLKWSLGRIKNVIRGEDGLVRVADIQTAKHIIRRPITKLAPLPVDSHSGPTLHEHAPKINTTRNRPSADDREKTTKPKAKRARLNTLSSTLFVLLLALPLCMTDNVEMLPFDSNPGLFFEKLGSASLIASEWNIVSYVDMTSYWKWTDRISQYPSILDNVCKQSNRSSCATVVSLLAHLTSELEQNNKLLRSNTPPRVRRGAVNIVGNIAHSLFGVLDESYASETANIIRKIEQNEGHLQKQIHQQKSFLDNTINIIKRDQREIEKEFQNIETTLNSVQHNLQQERLINDFNDLALQTTLALTYLQRIQESLLDVLTDSHHGKINPELISPQQLETEIQHIRASLPGSLKVPEASDLLKLFNLVHIESRIMKELAMFNIKIPLVTPEEYEILKVTPVPFVANNLFNQIKTNYSFLIINLHRDQYYPLKEKILTTCYRSQNGRFLCHQGQPLQLRGSNTARCEVNLLNQHKDKSSCTIDTIGPGPHWSQLYNPDWWLYSINGELAVNVVCNENLTKITLKNNGLIKLKDNCEIRQPFLTIRAYQSHKTSELKGYIPDIDAGALIKPPAMETKSPAYKARYATNITSVDQIQPEGLELNLIDDMDQHDVHQYILGYSCLLILLVVSCYLYTIKRQRSLSSPAATIKIATVEAADNDSQIITISNS